jgi:nitrite reductase/ring-hydroxylating ferredoxin subunit
MHDKESRCLAAMPQSTDERRWVPLCKLSDPIEPHGLPCQVEGHEIAVFLVDGRHFATSNICTHQFAYLTDGYVDGEYVDCPMHQGRFHIPSGAAIEGPVTQSLRTYLLRVDGDDVQVELPGEPS